LVFIICLFNKKDIFHFLPYISTPKATHIMTGTEHTTLKSCDQKKQKSAFYSKKETEINNAESSFISDKIKTSEFVLDEQQVEKDALDQNSLMKSENANYKEELSNAIFDEKPYDLALESVKFAQNFHKIEPEVKFENVHDNAMKIFNNVFNNPQKNLSNDIFEVENYIPKNINMTSNNSESRSVALLNTVNYIEKEPQLPQIEITMDTSMTGSVSSLPDLEDESGNTNMEIENKSTSQIIEIYHSKGAKQHELLKDEIQISKGKFTRCMRSMSLLCESDSNKLGCLIRLFIRTI
jgi:hypothetical protein